ncbi:MAG: hypothetical protein V1871_09350 [Planctomycetota bacterium]
MNNSSFSDRCLRITAEVLNNPTAPLREEMIQAYLREFVRKRPALTLCEDRAGNIVIQYTSRGASKNTPLRCFTPSLSGCQRTERPERSIGTLVMVAHMDHPGFWVEKVAGNAVKLVFKGGVGKPHARVGTRIKFFETGRSEPIGSGRLLTTHCRKGNLFSATALIVNGTALAGGIAMWDLPSYEIRNGLIISRVCDDLIGVAASLCTLNELARLKPAGVTVQGLFTRSEEIGFMGALEAIRLKTVPKNATVLSLETSKALANAPQGNGVILRVGDRASIFNPDMTDALWQVAGQLAKKDRTFKCQRRLMDGGTCEATVFCATGYRASGLAVPLGNYHNQAFDARHRPQIGAETVNVDDFICEIRLLVELALHPQNQRKPTGLPTWLKTRMQKARHALS